MDVLRLRPGTLLAARHIVVPGYAQGPHSGPLSKASRYACVALSWSQKLWYEGVGHIVRYKPTSHIPNGLSSLLFRSLFSTKGNQEVGSTYWIAIASQSIPPDTFRFRHQSVFWWRYLAPRGCSKQKWLASEEPIRPLSTWKRRPLAISSTYHHKLLKAPRVVIPPFLWTKTPGWKANPLR